MRIVALGVRGSTPAPGLDFAGYGGHTSCVAVLGGAGGAGGAEDVPALILDAGTGLRSLPTVLGGAAFTGHIVLTHLHWDHVQGLPFTPAIDRRDAEVTLHVPVGAAGEDPMALLARAMSPPHFPIGPDGLLGAWQFAALRPGTFAAAGATVTVAPVEHKGGVTFGLRIERDGQSLAYLPDHALTDHALTEVALAGAAGGAARALVDGVDLLLHDGQFLASESAIARNYGHATVEAVLRFADECAVGQLVLTHHAPSRTDAQLAAIAGAVTETPAGRPVRFARQDEALAVRLAR